MTRITVIHVLFMATKIA